MKRISACVGVAMVALSILGFLRVNRSNESKTWRLQRFTAKSGTSVLVERSDKSSIAVLVTPGLASPGISRVTLAWANGLAQALESKSLNATVTIFMDEVVVAVPSAPSSVWADYRVAIETIESLRRVTSGVENHRFVRFGPDFAGSALALFPSDHPYVEAANDLRLTRAEKQEFDVPLGSFQVRQTIVSGQFNSSEIKKNFTAVLEPDVKNSPTWLETPSSHVDEKEKVPTSRVTLAWPIFPAPSVDSGCLFAEVLEINRQLSLKLQKKIDSGQIVAGLEFGVAGAAYFVPISGANIWPTSIEISDVVGSNFEVHLSSSVLADAHLDAVQKIRFEYYFRPSLSVRAPKVCQRRIVSKAIVFGEPNTRSS